MLRSRCMLHASATQLLRTSVEKTYRKMNQREHIIKRPEMYVGQTHKVHEAWWTYDARENTMHLANTSYVPAFYKIFDEILVNASDNKVRDQASQTYIKVTADESTGRISVENDGSGIPVKMHEEYKMWVPQLIFGNLLTSSNYDDSVKRTTGGCYGYGAKLTNIFSSNFEVETYDPHTNRHFSMAWSNNMQDAGEPKVTENYRSTPLEERLKDGFTRISYLPDYKRLDMPDGLTPAMFGMVQRRVIDLAGILGETATVYLNERVVDVQSFEKYARLFPIKPEGIVHRKYPRWEITVGMSADEKFHGVSFVNSTFTSKNGTHLRYVLDAIITEIRAAITRTDPAIKVRADYIKQNIFLFVNAQIENPKFDSQQKMELTSRPSEFGSLPDTNELAAAVVRDTPICAMIIEDHQRRTLKKLAPVASKNEMLCIPKLEDAAKAGTAEAEKCTLIITEGDSAKALAMSGLNVVGRDYYGVFPIRGKLLNARGLSKAQIVRCEEIRNILRILGVSAAGPDDAALRYGRVMIMADQDVDGFHIKGLLCNLFQVVTPHLFQKPGFLTSFVTPIVKVTGPRGFSKSFYTTKEYTDFMDALPKEKAKQLRSKYYKGLGTSTAAEAREYFSNIERNTVEFAYDPAHDDKALEMPFGRINAEARREWIVTSSGAADLDATHTEKISYHDFVQKFLIQFSLQDCARSIPNKIDGLKTTQRKILFGALRRDLKSSIKVQQLAGYVSEHCAYHQNEASLTATIVRMAQDYVGANNLPLLDPEGQFGTRMENGDDAAASRYIFTRLQPITPLVFRAEDEPNLTMTVTDGQVTEPEFYVPVVPMLLINGAQGIATGFRTSIPPHRALDMIRVIRERLAGRAAPMPEAFHEGFCGTNRRTENGHQTIGAWRLMHESCIRITEIPTSFSVQAVKTHLTGLYHKGIVHRFSEHHSAHFVEFDVHCHPQVIELMIRSGAVHSIFHLVGTKSSEHLVSLDRSAVRQFESTAALFDEFYTTRLHYYGLRKASLLEALTRQATAIKNRKRFIEEVLAGKLQVPSEGETAAAYLNERGYEPHPKEKTYAYLLNQRMSALNKASVEAMGAKVASIGESVDALNRKSVEDMWRADLDELEAALQKRAANLPERPKREAARMKDIDLKADALATLKIMVRARRRS